MILNSIDKSKRKNDSRLKGHHQISYYNVP